MNAIGDFGPDLKDMKEHHPRCFEAQLLCGVFCFGFGILVTNVYWVFFR